MSITIKGTKISALQNTALLSDSTPVSGLESTKSLFINLLKKFTAEAQSSQRSENFLIKDSLLRVLGASAVESLSLALET